MPFNLYEHAELFIPKDKIQDDFLRLMGFTEKEIRDFYNKSKVHVWVNTRTHDMKNIEFDEYEEIK